MNKHSVGIYITFVGLVLLGCQAPRVTQLPSGIALAKVTFSPGVDTNTVATIPWRQFFKDWHLQSLIDTAIAHNPEYLSLWQEIEIARNEIKARHGEILPQVSLQQQLGVDKAARYTADGAGNASTDILPGKRVPEPIADIFPSIQARWEVDIWSKLHTLKKSAAQRLLATTEGRNWLLTNLVAEIAISYYELQGLDQQLRYVREALHVQQAELEVVKMQKQAAQATELAVKQFEAQVFNTQSREYDLLQQIQSTENRINRLLGQTPKPIDRDSLSMTDLSLHLPAGTPEQLLINRPDIRQAEWMLSAAGLDVRAARTLYLPSLGIEAGFGVQAFQPKYLFHSFESMTFGLVGSLAGPIINRKAIQAAYGTAAAKQQQAWLSYQQVIIQAVSDVHTAVSRVQNLSKQIDLRSKESAALQQAVDVSRALYGAARANYLEVLIAQRDALNARLDLVELTMQQWEARTDLYRQLGGGWR